MRANCWYGAGDLRVEQIPDPHLINPRDAVVRITSTAICGSDLHLYDGYIPTMEQGDILGHEFMGEVVETGPGVKNLKVGDRVVVPFPIACGGCFFCKRGLFSLCESSNPNAIMAAELLGAERVIAIDRFAERLRMAREHAGADHTLNYAEVSVPEALDELTGGRGPDACIDAVGMEAHLPGALGLYDRAKQALRLETGRAGALRQAIQACRNGGTVSVPGVYGGLLDSMPVGAVVNKALTIKSGQTHVQRYMQPLLERIEKGEIDPSFIITHRLSLDEAPRAYQLFRDKREECVKVVLKPGALNGAGVRDVAVH